MILHNFCVRDILQSEAHTLRFCYSVGYSPIFVTSQEMLRGHRNILTPTDFVVGEESVQTIG